VINKNKTRLPLVQLQTFGNLIGMIFRPKCFFLLSLLLLVSACGSPAQQNNSRYIQNSAQEIQSFFRHKIIIKKGTQFTNTLALFIEGDGLPWLNETHIATNPDPSTPLAFELMQRYPGPSVYLGRPCYFIRDDSRCHSRYWTSHRYSDEVVQSLVIVGQEILKNSNYEKLLLIGHSGGGTLASLMACSFDLPTKLVTLSANLDIDAWTQHHKWTKLEGSLNPTYHSQLCPQLTELHFQGDDDDIVPAKLNLAYFAARKLKPNIIAGASHTNWLQYWEQVLETLIANLRLKSD